MDKPGAPSLHFGYFPDFKGSPTVLFWGSAAGMEQFARFLREAASAGGTPQPLNDVPWTAARAETRISVEIGAADAGMDHAPGAAEGELRWRLTGDTARHFADLVEVVAGSAAPSHTYLDAGTDEACTVVISKGEYDGL